MTRTHSPTIRPPIWCLVAIIAIAGLLRLGATNETVVDRPVRADAAEYLAYAYNMRHNGVYSREFRSDVSPDAHRSPGYPLFLLPFSSELPSERSIYLITLVQALIGTLTVLLTFALFRRWLGEVTALVAALLTAISPHLVSAGTYVLTETLFCLALTAVLWAATRLDGRPTPRDLIILGAMLGAATLIRPSTQYFLPVLIAVLFVHFGRGGSRMVVPVALGFALLYTPWVVRNLLAIGQWTDPQLSTNFLHHGMYPGFTYRDIVESYGFPYRFDPNTPAIAASTSATLAEIARRFVEEPLRHLHWFLIGKPLAFLSWDVINGFGDVFVYPTIESPYFSDASFSLSHTVMRALHWPLMIAGVFGAILAWLPARTEPSHSLLGARVCSSVLLYFLAIHMLGAPFPRYAVPLRPLTFGLALYALLRVGQVAVTRIGGAKTPARSMA